MKLRVEAIRDDGTVLVSAGSRAAVQVTPDGAWVTTVEAAQARGVWRAPRGDERVPPELSREVIKQVQKVDRELDRSQPPEDVLP